MALALPTRWWLLVLLWGCTSRLIHSLAPALAPPFVLASTVAAMIYSLDSARRKAGEQSSYSIFNEGCKAIADLPGSRTTEQLVVGWGGTSPLTH